MRHPHVVVSLVLSAFVSASIGCKIAETPPPPPPHSMVFKRDLSSGKGCLEYAWESPGKRQLIQLNPTIKEGEGAGPTATDTSRVQVYALSNGLYGLKEWQFPSGPTSSLPVVRAIVELKEIEAVGIVFYQDESSASETKSLQPMPVNCPAKLEAVTIVDPEITALDPRSIPRDTAGTITLMGSNFTRDSVVLIDGANPTTQYVSPSMLEVALEAPDTESPGKRSVRVHGAKDGRTSNEMMLFIQ